MKKLARLAALLLAAVMAMTMLAGCSGEFQTNPQAEEAILKYVQENYATRDTPLPNDTAMRRKAAEVLAKVNDDGEIAEKDFYQITEIEYGANTKNEVTIACIVLDDDEFPYEHPDEMHPMEAYTAGQLPDALRYMLHDSQWITSFGVATRVIDGKTYVAVSYVCRTYYHEGYRPI